MRAAKKEGFLSPPLTVKKPFWEGWRAHRPSK